MFWSHIYDLAGKLGVLIVSILLLNNLPFFTDNGIAVVTISILVCIVSYIFFFRTVGSYLYSRVALKMRISFREAKKLNAALAPNPFPFTDLTWLPLKEVKELNDDIKYSTALKLLDRWNEEKMKRKREQAEKSKNTSKQIKVIEAALGILTLLCFITSILNLPPASIAIDYYCRIFNTDTYSPMLIGCILTLIILLPLLLIKKNIQSKDLKK